MKRFLLKSWKTTAAGLLIGTSFIAPEVVKLQSSGDPITWGNIGIGVGVSLLGIFAKDGDKSGT